MPALHLNVVTPLRLVEIVASPELREGLANMGSGRGVNRRSATA
jgi:hypothetical protein